MRAPLVVRSRSFKQLRRPEAEFLANSATCNLAVQSGFAPNCLVGDGDELDSLELHQALATDVDWADEELVPSIIGDQGFAD